MVEVEYMVGGGGAGGYRESPGTAIQDSLYS